MKPDHWEQHNCIAFLFCRNKQTLQKYYLLQNHQHFLCFVSYAGIVDACCLCSASKCLFPCTPEAKKSNLNIVYVPNRRKLCMLCNFQKIKIGGKSMLDLFNLQIFLLFVVFFPLAGLTLVGLHQQMEMRSIRE